MKITGSLNGGSNWKWWYFEWSTKQNFRPTDTSPRMTTPTGGTVTAQTGTLLPGTTYYFRIVGGHDAVASDGKTKEFTFWGDVEKCTTPGSAPTPEPTNTDETIDEFEGEGDPTPEPTTEPTNEPTTEPTAEPSPTPTPKFTTEPEKPITIDPKVLPPPPGQEWDSCQTKLIDPVTGASVNRVETEQVITSIVDCKIVVFPKQVTTDQTPPTVIELRMRTTTGTSVTTEINVRTSRKSAQITLTNVTLQQLPKTGESTADLQRNGLLLLLCGLLLMPLAATAPARRRK